MLPGDHGPVGGWVCVLVMWAMHGHGADSPDIILPLDQERNTHFFLIKN